MSCHAILCNGAGCLICALFRTTLTTRLLLRPQRIKFASTGTPMVRQTNLFCLITASPNALLNGDPYHCECYKTSRLIATELGLDESQYITTFQSRFGREEWLKPYTDDTLKSLPAQGINSVQVFCPGFSADCLETIEEIGEENKEYFLHAGGQRYEYISALNAEPGHIAALCQLIYDNLHGWHYTSANDKALHAEALKQKVREQT